MKAPKIARAQWVHVEKLLGDARFASTSSTESNLFAYLARRTVSEPGFDEKRVEEVAQDYFGAVSGQEVGRFGVRKARLNRRLARYYATFGKDEAVVLSASRTYCYIEFRYRPEQAPALNWSDQFADEAAAHVSTDRFRRFLEEHSNTEGASEVARDRRINSWVTPQEKFPREAASGFSGFFDYLAASKTALSYREMRELAEAIGIHRLMLDPLLSALVETDALVLRLPSAASKAAVPTTSTQCSVGSFGTTAALDPTRKVFRHNEDHYGSDSVYGVPSLKLASTDASFVFLHLAPGGFTTVHHHPGDELVLVLHGSISITFNDTGLKCDIAKGGFAHFYAEQNHSVANITSESAHLFIIRFYQLHVHRTRQAMREELWRVSSQSGSTAQSTLDNLTWGWILNAVADRSVRLSPPGEIPKEVGNRFGLVRFLKRSSAPKDARSIRGFLTKVNADSSLHVSGRPRPRYKELDEWLWAVQSNQITLPSHLLPAIIDLYGVFDLLACEFLFPGVQRHVVVHGGDGDRHDDWIDMSTVVAELNELQEYGMAANRGASLLGQGTVKYEVPIRSLSCSDVAVSRLSLKPGFHTTENSHPGYELLLPIAGTIALEYLDAKEPRVATVSAREHVLHFNSRLRHRLNNVGKVPATMFLIRFYGEGVPHRAGDTLEQTPRLKATKAARRTGRRMATNR